MDKYNTQIHCQNNPPSPYKLRYRSRIEYFLVIDQQFTSITSECQDPPPKLLQYNKGQTILYPLVILLLCKLPRDVRT